MSGGHPVVAVGIQRRDSGLAESGEPVHTFLLFCPFVSGTGKASGRGSQDKKLHFWGDRNGGARTRTVPKQSRSFADAGRRKSPEAVPRQTASAGRHDRTDHRLVAHRRRRKAVIQRMAIGEQCLGESKGDSRRAAQCVARQPHVSGLSGDAAAAGSTTANGTWPRSRLGNRITTTRSRGQHGVTTRRRTASARA
jgi:hypothetical protein